METKMYVQIFKRPQESPILSEIDTDIRINYNGNFIDFRNGKIKITDEITGEPKNHENDTRNS